MKNFMKNKQTTVENILLQLEDFSLPEQVEILANVFIFMSRSTGEIPEVVFENHEQLIDLLIKFRQTHGETMGTALALQGLTLFTWLDKEKR